MPMRMVRSGIAIDPRFFGKRTPGFILGDPDEKTVEISDDVKLFATTFAIGFIFVSVLIF